MGLSKQIYIDKKEKKMKKLVTLLSLTAAIAAFAQKAPVPPIMTPWGEKVTSENAWREYPRPQMVRPNWVNLNGDWDYAVTSITNTPGRPKQWDGKIRVPFAIESVLSGVARLMQPDEFLWYTRQINCERRRASAFCCTLAR